MGKFKWAYLGAGNIAETTAAELVEGNTSEIAAVWNRTRTRSEAFAERFGATVYETPEEAIRAPGVEGVYIALTADRHAEFMKRCIECGKAVLCEKPFAINKNEAKEVFRLAKEKGVYVSEAMWTWHNAPAQKVKEWVDGGRLGEIRTVKATYAWPVLRYVNNPRLTDNAMIGGALMDIGIYAVTYAYRLFGLPLSIRCSGRIRNGVDYGEDVRMEYPGFTAELHVAMDEDNGGEYFEIIGTKGSIHVPMFHMADSAERHGETTERFERKANLYDVEFSNVAQEIRAGVLESRWVSPKHTLDVMGLLDECRAQMGVQYPTEKEQAR